jgi:acetyl esterase/lipase
MSVDPVTEAAVQAIVDRIRAVYGRWGRGTGIDAMRRDWEALYKPDSGVPAPTAVSANGVRAAWIGAPDAAPDRAVLFFHGGGFQMGSLDTHRTLMANIADASGCRVLGVDYRLAPEHRFPAPVEDALAAYDWLVGEGFMPAQIALVGDSAGGGLALALLLALKARGAALPAAAAVMSPWTDMEASGHSYETRAAADPIHQRPMIQALARAYLGRDGDPRDPLASPIHGDLAGLPPLLIQVGDRETVLDDAAILAERAKAAGVDATLEIWDGMIHVFQLYAAELPQARAALDRIGGFLRRHLDVATGGPRRQAKERSGP